MDDMTRGLPSLVGLMGKARAGKDTVAAALGEERGFRRFAFADALKSAALGLDPLVQFGDDETALAWRAGAPSGLRPVRLSEVVDALGWEEAKGAREVRRTLQRLGVAMRAIQNDIWINGPLREAQHVRARGVPVVFTDVRFPNEARAIRQSGGVLVRVERPDLESDDRHVSEVGLDDWQADANLINDGTVEDLRKAARLLARSLP